MSKVHDMLEVDDLVVEYGPVRAVTGASLRIGAGEIVGLIGPNGAGKTSTVQAVCGLVPAAGGTVRLAGRPIGGLSTQRRVRAGLTLVPQGRQVFPNLTVAENLRLGAWIRRAGTDPLDDFPLLRGKLKQSAGTLSGGEQQLLALARALASRPTCLLLDEPSMGLSPLLIGQVAEAIRTLASERGLTVLVVDQGLGIVRRITSRIYVMARGRIAAEHATDAIGDGRDIEHAYFGGA